jgi:hypothetical protein
LATTGFFGVAGLTGTAGVLGAAFVAAFVAAFGVTTFGSATFGAAGFAGAGGTTLLEAPGVTGATMGLAGPTAGGFDTTVALLVVAVDAAVSDGTVETEAVVVTPDPPSASAVTGP